MLLAPMLPLFCAANESAALVLLPVSAANVVVGLMVSVWDRNVALESRHIEMIAAALMRNFSSWAFGGNAVLFGTRALGGPATLFRSSRILRSKGVKGC